MKRLTFTFAQRVQLMGILDDANGRDGGREKLLSLDALYSKIRLTDDERKRIKTIEMPDGGTFFKPLYPCGRCDGLTVEGVADGFKCSSCGTTHPAGTFPEFGAKVLPVEDAEARWAVRQMEIWEPNCRRRDLEWFIPLYEALAAKEKGAKK